MVNNRNSFRYSDFKCNLSDACIRFPGIDAYVRIGEKLGCGAYGDVFRGYRMDDSADVSSDLCDSKSHSKRRNVIGSARSNASSTPSTRTSEDVTAPGGGCMSLCYDVSVNQQPTITAQEPPVNNLPVYAVKYFKDDIVHIMEEGISPGTLRELSIMKSCNDHPNIVKLVDVYVGPHPGIVDMLNQQLGDALKSSGTEVAGRKDLQFFPFKKSQIFMFALYEYCEGGDLGRAIWRAYSKNQPGYSLSEVKWYAFQLLNGLAYLHMSKIEHRDLKPNNIMLSDSERLTVLKIGDWGMGREFRNLDGTVTPTACTLFYRPIEVILGPMNIPPADPEAQLGSRPLHRHNYGINADIWSAACIIAELVTGFPLFHGNSDFQVLTRIVTTLGRPTEDEWRNCSRSEHYPFNGSLYNVHVEDKKERLRSVLRGKMDDVGLDLLLSLLQYNPHKRLSALEALSHPWFHDVDYRRLDSMGVRNCLTNALMGRFGASAIRNLEDQSRGITSTTLLSHMIYNDSDIKGHIMDAIDRDYTHVNSSLRQCSLPVAIQYNAPEKATE
ncbi:protein kinase domain containing protein [Babesia bovis T2Bo]|uniref:protein kinase domain containing protein n=1 Tax=Babesia bovis T2Bo TaxID=484906 RepID=UPI001C3534D7|nr:protein kinase domain containing protein [Babesia bovis T2Bo]EDO08445.2 protein kinase domain containing protein [Babesia bovis T2Bo]